jgi:type IV pilus biogenesis protein CpaD/CtpE
LITLEEFLKRWPGRVDQTTKNEIQLFIDTVTDLSGDVVQILVGQGKASIDDPRMAEEASIIDKAAALGLPQKIRELAAFALSKKDKWSVRPKDSEANE